MEFKIDEGESVFIRLEWSGRNSGVRRFGFLFKFRYSDGIFWTRFWVFLSFIVVSCKVRVGIVVLLVIRIN